MKKSRWFAVMLALVLLLSLATIVSALTYRVKWGDTLLKIANQFGTTVEAIAQENQISNPNLIYVDQLLTIPGTGEDPAPNPDPPPAPPPPSPPPPGGATYVVKPGDTLSKIARQFGTSYLAIARLNGIANPNFISVGQVLKIPDGSNAPPPPAPPAPPPPPPPSTGGAFEIGGQSTGLGNHGRMTQAGMKWFKLQYKWGPGDDPNVLAGQIQDAHNKGFKILLSIPGRNTHPAPGSLDFNAYVNFLGALAPLGPDAIEVWNEMNIDVEWPTGEINPTTYVTRMLAPAYSAIKAANPNVLVITGALAPTGFDNGSNAWADDRYLAGMKAAGAANYADCIGVHHNAGATSPNVTTGHPASYHYSWYFRPTLDLYYNTFGGSRKLCFTELGYVSADGFAGIPPGFAWGSGTSVSEHAQWLAEAVSLSAATGKVRLLIVYNVDFTNYDLNGDPQAGYAMIRPDGSCPACDTIGAVMNP
jgi:LysM repeat protein